MANTTIKVDLIESLSPVLAFIYPEEITYSSGNPAGYTLYLGDEAFDYSFVVPDSCSGIYRIVVENGDGVSISQGYVWIEGNTTDSYTADSSYNQVRIRKDAQESIISQIGIAGSGLNSVPWNNDWGAEIQAGATASLSSYNVATAPNLAVVDSNVDAVLNDLTTIASGGLGLINIPWNSSWDSEVQSEVNDALTAFWVSKDSLVDAVWNEATSGYVTAGTFGLMLNTTNTNSVLIDNNVDSILTIVNNILVDTSVIGSAGAGLSNIPWNASWDAYAENATLSALSGYGVTDGDSLTLSGIADYLDTSSIFADRIYKMPRSNSGLSDGEAYQKSLDGFTNYISEQFRKTP